MDILGGGFGRRVGSGRLLLPTLCTILALVAEFKTNLKWKWAGHITHMKDNRWTIKSTEWQIKGVRSVGRPKHRWRDDIVGQQGAVWTRTAKDRERWRTLAEGYFLQWKDIA